jgi:GMP synthase (glutamine-hydrolysing)
VFRGAGWGSRAPGPGPTRGRDQPPRSQPRSSHHNVGGLPERMKMELVGLRSYSRTRCAPWGAAGLPRGPRPSFQGPGLLVRILGPVTPKGETLAHADDIFLTEKMPGGALRRSGRRAVLLPVRTVRVMGDGRTYDQVGPALRAVTSSDG